MQGVTLMLMMRNDLLLLSDEEVLSSVEAYKKSMKKSFPRKKMFQGLRTGPVGELCQMKSNFGSMETIEFMKD